MIQSFLNDNEIDSILADPLSPKLAYLAEFLCRCASTNNNHDKNHRNTRYDPHLPLCPRFGTGGSNQIHHWPLHGDLLGHCPGNSPDGTSQNCILLERRLMKTDQNLWHDLFDTCVIQLENAAALLDQRVFWRKSANRREEVPYLGLIPSFIINETF